MKRLSNILCLLLLAANFLLPLTCWVMSMAGFDVVNPISEEAIRWLFKQGPMALVSVHLALVILLLTAIGAVRESGIIEAMRHPFAPALRRALTIATVFFFSVFVILLLPLLLPHNALLSITGGLLPSPWLCGFPLALCVDVILTAALFSLIKQTWQSIYLIPHLLSEGLSRYGLLVVDFMMASLLFSMFQYYLL